MASNARDLEALARWTKEDAKLPAKLKAGRQARIEAQAQRTLVPGIEALLRECDAPADVIADVTAGMLDAYADGMDALAATREAADLELFHAKVEGGRKATKTPTHPQAQVEVTRFVAKYRRDHFGAWPKAAEVNRHLAKGWDKPRNVTVPSDRSVRVWLKAMREGAWPSL